MIISKEEALKLKLAFKHKEILTKYFQMEKWDQLFI